MEEVLGSSRCRESPLLQSKGTHFIKSYKLEQTEVFNKKKELPFKKSKTFDLLHAQIKGI
jgi:hypothetical protein